MMIGPAPMIRIVEIFVRLGIWSRQSTQYKAVHSAFARNAARGGSQNYCRSTLGCLRRRDLGECEQGEAASLVMLIPISGGGIVRGHRCLSRPRTPGDASERMRWQALLLPYLHVEIRHN